MGDVGLHVDHGRAVHEVESAHDERRAAVLLPSDLAEFAHGDAHRVGAPSAEREHALERVLLVAGGVGSGTFEVLPRELVHPADDDDVRVAIETEEAILEAYGELDARLDLRPVPEGEVVLVVPDGGDGAQGDLGGLVRIGHGEIVAGWETLTPALSPCGERGAERSAPDGLDRLKLRGFEGRSMVQSGGLERPH